MKVNKQSPPHPRGSTWSIPINTICAKVSPAPAGIDPPVRTLHPDWPRLPRTRGDRPIPIVASEVITPSPPHPRGSTLSLSIRNLAGIVSPAPAGIDPSGTFDSYSYGSLPRTRGDRPKNEIFV